MTYEYECDDKHRTEKFCMPETAEEIECPACGKIARRAITAHQAVLFSWRPDQVRAAMGKKE